jgi:hypothetical protein
MAAKCLRHLPLSQLNKHPATSANPHKGNDTYRLSSPEPEDEPAGVDGRLHRQKVHASKARPTVGLGGSHPVTLHAKMLRLELLNGVVEPIKAECRATWADAERPPEDSRATGGHLGAAPPIRVSSHVPIDTDASAAHRFDRDEARTILGAVVLLVATGCNGDDPQPPNGTVEISDATR